MRVSLGEITLDVRPDLDIDRWGELTAQRPTQPQHDPTRGKGVTIATDPDPRSTATVVPLSPCRKLKISP